MPCETCPKCDGSGILRRDGDMEADSQADEIQCPRCGGDGVIPTGHSADFRRFKRGAIEAP